MYKINSKVKDEYFTICNICSFMIHSINILISLTFSHFSSLTSFFSWFLNFLKNITNFHNGLQKTEILMDTPYLCIFHPKFGTSLFSFKKTEAIATSTSVAAFNSIAASNNFIATSDKNFPSNTKVYSMEHFQLFGANTLHQQ